MTTAIIAGLDEAGRGALAGPVVAGACVLREPLRAIREPFLHWIPEGEPDIIIADSKKLSPEQRERSALWIADHAYCGVGITGHDVIDGYGILEATEQAMKQALAEVEAHITPTYLLIDGHDHFFFLYPKSSVVHGDALEPTIAAASILAKVARDRIMIEEGTTYPLYDFARHKGYGTEEHCSRIAKHGPCAIHRTTFLKKITGAAAGTTTRGSPRPQKSAVSEAVLV